MSRRIVPPRTHVAHLYIGYRFSKQYDRFMEYVHSILMLKQPEIYINTIFFHNDVQFVVTWRNVDTQQISCGTINLYNNIKLPKNVTSCKAIFDMIVDKSCTFGTSPYADLCI